MAAPIEIPYDALSLAALEGLVEEFITREGTDYGTHVHSLEEKRASVLTQLERREIAIVFDPDSESTTLLPCPALAALGLR